MKRLLVLALFATGAVIWALVAGCSSTSTGPAALMVGDTNSPVFQTASGVFDTAQAYSNDAFSGSFDLAGGIFAAKSPSNLWAGSPQIVNPAVYHADSKFWFRSRTGTEYRHRPGNPDSITDSLAWVRNDSIQFRTVDSAVMTPDSATLAEVKSGCSFNVRSYNGPDSLSAGHVFDVVGAAGAIWGKGDVVINGAGSTNADLTKLKHRQDTLTICDITVGLSSMWNNLHANLAQVLDSGGCPSSGVISHAGTLNVACSQALDSLKFNGSWSRTKTFNNGMITIVFQSPTTQWTVTRTCGSHSGGLASPFVDPKNQLAESK